MFAGYYFGVNVSKQHWQALSDRRIPRDIILRMAHHILRREGQDCGHKLSNAHEG
jgi:hypothetical protein